MREKGMRTMIRSEQQSARLRRGALVAAVGLVLSTGCAAAAIGLGVVCCATPAVAAAAVTNDSHGGGEDANEASVAIEIPEVGCAGCSLEVRKALKGAGGVRRLNEGSPKNRIIVTFEPGTGRPDVYVEALHKAGFVKAHAVG